MKKKKKNDKLYDAHLPHEYDAFKPFMFCVTFNFIYALLF